MSLDKDRGRTRGRKIQDAKPRDPCLIIPMRNKVLEQAIKSAAAPERARAGFEQLLTAGGTTRLAKISPEQARLVAALFSGSQAMGNLLLAHPEWVGTILHPERLEFPRQAQGLRREVEAALQPALQARDYAGALMQIREFKQREMLRIATRDLARLSNAPQITREVSDLADVCLGAVLQICRQQLLERFGQPFHQDGQNQWQQTGFAVIGLGKLGGQELNYSSDVDVVFVYTEEGSVFKQSPSGAAAPAAVMSNHQFFKRLAEVFMAEITRQTPHGFLFRIDLRLRPEGDAGPLVRSLSSYENFYAQWGQTWERMMLIKARGVAGDGSLAADFLELVQPFRYPRSLNQGFLREVAAMKTRIENEVVRAGEIERNVKLGRGGIREIEFAVQTLQLLHAGRIPFLQTPQTLPALQKLTDYHLVAAAEAEALSSAYCFLRDVEHRLQMENNLQTHTIPADAKARRRLAALMGFKTLAAFDKALKAHTVAVRQFYDRQLRADAAEAKGELPRQFQGAEAEWKQLLAEHSFKDVDKSFRLLNEFANGPGYVHVSTRTMELAWQLLPKLLALCPDGKGSRREPKENLRRVEDSSVASTVAQENKSLSDPDRVVARLDSFISAYGSRAMLFETWAAHPSLFELLLLLFDRSEFLAEMAIRTPDLVDELVLSGRLRRRKTMEETLQDLRHGREDKDQLLWLRRYHQAEFMRIGLRDILGLADFEQNLLELSNLADACLHYALEATLRKHRLRTSPLVVVGLGKLGGQEITYGSDLDIIFVARDGTKNLPQLQRLAVDFMEMLSSPTELGIAFVTDARLRPDGEKGLLVNTLSAYEEYYRRRAQLWEIQSLSRTRSIAGDPELGRQFQTLAGALTDFTPGNVAAKFAVAPSRQPKRGPAKAGKAGSRLRHGLAAFTAEWKKEIARMRQRIEKERTPAGQDALAIKTGAGGLMDAEFIAQTLCLEHGWQEANALRALQRGQAANALEPAAATSLIEHYCKLRRVEGILRRWSFEGETVLPADPAPFYRVSVRCGFETPEAFRQAMAECRRAIRKVYSSFMNREPRPRS